jgi:outer membrane protein OmpA-like peptidoglycan-associated protein
MTITISATYAQIEKPNYFKLTDTSFNVKDIHIMKYIIIDWACWPNKPDTNFIKVADSIKDFLKIYPSVKIEIGMHTDFRGSIAYNDTLSFKRAESIVYYLISMGIPKDRIIPFGYGGKVPRFVTSDIAKQYPYFTEGTMIDKKTIDALETTEKKEIGYLLNRRLEIKILKK